MISNKYIHWCAFILLIYIFSAYCGGDAGDNNATKELTESSEEYKNWCNVFDEKSNQDEKILATGIEKNEVAASNIQRKNRYAYEKCNIVFRTMHEKCEHLGSEHPQTSLVISLRNQQHESKEQKLPIRDPEKTCYICDMAFTKKGSRKVHKKSKKHRDKLRSYLYQLGLIIEK